LNHDYDRARDLMLGLTIVRVTLMTNENLI